LVLSSYLTFDIPITDTGIPITAQSLAVILLIYFLNWKESLCVIVCYLFIGAVGLPVFANGKSGLSVLTGKSGGFLYGFALSALLMNLLHNKLKRTNWGKILFLGLATAYILLFGFIHLSGYLGIEKAYLYGIAPFLPGALIKLALAFVVVKTLESIMHTKLT